MSDGLTVKALLDLAKAVGQARAQKAISRQKKKHGVSANDALIVKKPSNPHAAAVRQLMAAAAASGQPITLTVASTLVKEQRLKHAKR